MLIPSILSFALLAPVPAAKVPTSEAVAAGSKEFDTRVREYLDLRNKLDGDLPHLSKEATPEEVDRHQVALEERIRAARAGAKAGDLFSPPIQDLVRRTLQLVLAGPDGKKLRASIMDENPGVSKIVLNSRYPSAIPFSTMPPQVLEELPQLAEGLEYRFLGPRLILLDTRADLIVDCTEPVLPK